jgi:DNA polymerase-3 subunit epsilon
VGFDFTTIDFETANHHRGSPCAVGLTRVRNDEIVDAATWLMQPPPQYAGFEPYNTRVHGIGSQDVAGEPTFEDRLPRILEFIGSDVVCAHNARFDGAVLAAAAIAVGAEPPDLRYLCTLTAARRCLELPSYRLPFVAQALGVTLGNHHEAGADSLAVALLVPRLAAELSASNLEKVVAITQTAPRPPSLPTIDRPHPGASPAHPLWGRVIVFTGALSSMTRQLAHEESIRVGGLPEKTVTKRTNILVVGDLDPMRLVPGDTTSQKAQKAFKLRAAGQDIEVMTEYDFLQSI